MMNRILGDLLYKTCFVFIDDVVIYGKTENEVISRTKQVLSKIFDDNLKIGGKKCEYVIKRASILGH
jgi:orotate phosphoribosyltransferase-like protein